MKFNFLKFNKKSLPSLKSLQPQIFDINLFWFSALGLFLVIFVITGLIGFRFFYSQYTGSYKESEPSDSFGNLMNVDKLKSAIQKRNDFINQKISLSKDPSL